MFILGTFELRQGGLGEDIVGLASANSEQKRKQNFAKTFVV